MRSIIDREIARLDRDDKATPQMPHTVGYFASGGANAGVKSAY
jgi:hypothetical protein